VTGPEALAAPQPAEAPATTEYDADAHAGMLDALDRGDKVGAQRLLDTLNAGPETRLEATPAWHAAGMEAPPESVEAARAGAEHIVAIAPGFLDTLLDEDASGAALGDDKAMIAVSEDISQRLQARASEDGWDADAKPPSIAPDLLADAVDVIRSQNGGEGVLQEMGAGTPEFGRSVGFVYAAAKHVAAAYPDLLAKFMAPDPAAPGRVIGDRPDVIRAAAMYGRLLVHARPAGRAQKGTSPMTGPPTYGAPEPASAAFDVDELIQAKMSAMYRGDRVKAAKIEKQLEAHFRRQPGGTQPLVGKAGRYV